MDPAAATNGSHHQCTLSAWGEAAGVGGSIADGAQEPNGRVCKIAAAHSAQMGELRRRLLFYHCLNGDWARTFPASGEKREMG